MKAGVTITSRGCIRSCGFCLVPQREGKTIRELPIVDGWDVADNNLLACTYPHLERVFEMLRRQPQPIRFSGGLDARLFLQFHVDLLKTIRLKFAWFACDTREGLPHLERVAQLLTGFSREKKRCYVLIGYHGETLQEAEKRLETVYALDFLPYAMVYRGPDDPKYGDRALHELAAVWRRPAAYKARMKRRQG